MSTTKPARASGKLLRPERSSRIANQLHWPLRFLRLLGKISDPSLAVRMGVSLTAVIAERRRRGVGPFRVARPPVRWTPEMVALLGEDTDPAVAAVLGIGPSSVAYKRTVLGIAPHVEPRTRRKRSVWMPSQAALLGTDFDKRVARRLGLSAAVVAKERRRRGIAPFVPRRPAVAWRPDMVRQLGKLADGRIAQRYGIGVDTVRRERQRRGVPPVKNDAWKVLQTPALARLLRAQTRDVVKRTGLNEKTVRRLRHDLGMKQVGTISPWAPRVLRQLGKVSDAKIAERIGCSVHTVRQKRCAHGVLRRVTRRWTAREDALVRTLAVDTAARRTGRTRKAVEHRRRVLGLRRAGPG